MKKLLNKKGESLIESLVSILIFTLSSILLYTMLSTAANLNRAAKEADMAHQQQMVHAEQAETAALSGQVVTFRYVHNGTSTVLFSYNTVNVYRLNADALYSYALD